MDHDPNRRPISLEYRNPDISREEAKRGRRAYRWIVGIACVLVIFAAVVAVMLRTNQLPRRESRQVHDAFNLHDVGLACQIYCNNSNGRFPASFEEMILTTDLTPHIFVDPRSTDTPAPGATKEEWAANLSTGGHCSYIYAGKGLTDKLLNPSDVAVAYDRQCVFAGNSGIWILYADGHVQWQTGKSLASILAAATKPPIFPPPTNPMTMP